MQVLVLTKTNGVQSPAPRSRAAPLQLSPGTLAVGSIYQLRVRARVSTAPEQTPFIERFSSTADAISNPFLAQ